MIRLALLGATGRMGQRVLSLLSHDNRFQLVAAITRPGDSRLGEKAPVHGSEVVFCADTDTAFDVMLDFSVPVGTMQWLHRCEQLNAAMVIGATGYTDEQIDRISDAATRCPVVFASNFSVGVNLLSDLVADVARKLGDGYDIEIVESHHNQKVDAPSGTAKSLLDVLVQATGRDTGRNVIHGRHGEVGVRPPREIGVHSIRMGDIVGQHEIHFSTAGETLTLRHVAHSRDTFARGALRAATWIPSRPPGLYSMNHVLGAAS